MERQRYPQDPQLTASLKRLKDWKEYQAYFQRGTDRLMRNGRDRRAVEAIQRNDPAVDGSTGHGKFRGLHDKAWLKGMERRREKLVPEEKRLEWVKKQLPAILLECAVSLMELPSLVVRWRRGASGKRNESTLLWWRELETDSSDSAGAYPP